MASSSYESRSVEDEGPIKKPAASSLLFLFIVSVLILIGSIVFFVILLFLILNSNIVSFTPFAGEINATEIVDGPFASQLRLPKNIRPNDYSLQIEVYLPGYKYNPGKKSMQFKGKNRINISVFEPADLIKIHSVDLAIKSVSVKNTDGTKVKVSKLELRTSLQMLFIYLDKTIQEGNYFLEIGFTGNIRKDLSGLYEAKYKENGVTRTIAVTQFEPSSARKMVPCFDEPGMKANWSVTVVHPKGTVALSNGIELSTKIHSVKNLLITKFKTTPKMSSYLLAICVADFVKRERRSKNGVLFRIWAKRSMHSNTEYALEAGIKATDYYEEYFDIPFPLEKQDMIAIPDFEMGAMENWGMVTYREVDLLFDPAVSPVTAKQRIAVIVAHELAHQWFGNLVTMKWWDDVWLNEGFATYIEHVGADVISDYNFKLEDTFVQEAQSIAFAIDAQSTSHPLSFPIAKVDEASEAFDRITYKKGGSVLRMLKYVMGEDYFKEGLRYYLKTHAYGNAKVSDLFNALDKKSRNDLAGPDGERLDIVKFANQYIKQMGHPLLTVTRKNATHVMINQNRYKNNPKQLDNPKYSNPKFKFRWDVPIWYQAGTEKREKFVWLPADESILIEAKDPIVLNTDSRAFYQVNYDKKILKSIAQRLDKNVKAYSARTKYRLLEDAFLMAEKGKIDYKLLIDLLKFVAKEKELLPWQAALGGLNSIKNIYGTDPQREPINEFIRKLIKKSGLNPQWSNINKHDKDDEKYEQVILANILKSYDEDMVPELLDAYNDKVLKTCSAKKMSTECSMGIPAPMRSTVFCTAVKKLGKKAFNRVIEFLEIGVQPYEQRMLLASLACSSEPVLLKKLFLLALTSTDLIRLQDSYLPFQRATRTDVGKEMSLSILLENYDLIYKKTSANGSLLRPIISYLTNNIHDESSLKALEQFIESTPGASDITTFKSAVENAKVRIEWRSKYFDKVSDLFKKAASSL